jgi:hypothetical protein
MVESLRWAGENATLVELVMEMENGWARRSGSRALELDEVRTLEQLGCRIDQSRLPRLHLA